MSDMSIEATPRLFTVEEYHAMADAGIIAEGERVELLDGQIVEMSPIGLDHWDLHDAIVSYLKETAGARARIVGQASFPLDRKSEPQPDVAILAPIRYAKRRAGPSGDEFFALIEIAQTSRSIDLGRKAQLYARAAIRDYVVIDLDRGLVVHHAEPHGDRYAKVTQLRTGDAFAIAALPDLTLDAAALLPAP